MIVDVRQAHDGTMAWLRAGLAALADPPPTIVAAVEAFDPDRRAVVFGVFLVETPTLVGRPIVAHRRPEWVALEDKTAVDDLLDRAGVRRAPSVVVPIAGPPANGSVDDGPDRLGGRRPPWLPRRRPLTRWVTDDAEAAAVTAELAPQCRTVRIMPFLDGVATSVHGLVLPDGVAVLRPVELVTLRQGHDLRYCGCATFWDPPAALRDDMREAARRLGDALPRRGRLPGRVHARRCGDGRRLPANRAEPALRGRPRCHHARARRAAVDARARPRRRRSDLGISAPTSSPRCSPTPTAAAAVVRGSCTSGRARGRRRRRALLRRRVALGGTR